MTEGNIFVQRLDIEATYNIECEEILERFRAGDISKESTIEKLEKNFADFTQWSNAKPPVK